MNDSLAELAEIKDRFLKHSDADLMRAAARQIYAGAILLMQEMQGKVTELAANPRDGGSLFKSLAQAVKAANDAMAVLVNIRDKLAKTIEATEQDGVQEEDDFGGILEAYRGYLKKDKDQ